MRRTAYSHSGGVSYPGICAGASNILCCKTGSSSNCAVPIRPTNTILTDLADVLRRAGLTVVEEPGWKTRGHGVMTSVKAILIHHSSYSRFAYR